MDDEKQRTIASKGGRAAHAKGTAHEWSREEARAAGRKGGENRGHRGRLFGEQQISGGSQVYPATADFLSSAGSLLKTSGTYGTNGSDSTTLPQPVRNIDSGNLGYAPRNAPGARAESRAA